MGVAEGAAGAGLVDTGSRPSEGIAARRRRNPPFRGAATMEPGGRRNAFRSRRPSSISAGISDRRRTLPRPEPRIAGDSRFLRSGSAQSRVTIVGCARRASALFSRDGRRRASNRISRSRYRRERTRGPRTARVGPEGPRRIPLRPLCWLELRNRRPRASERDRDVTHVETPRSDGWRFRRRLPGCANRQNGTRTRRRALRGAAGRSA